MMIPMALFEVGHVQNLGRDVRIRVMLTDPTACPEVQIVQRHYLDVDYDHGPFTYGDGKLLLSLVQ
jgi:hypothetical protein